MHSELVRSRIKLSLLQKRLQDSVLEEKPLTSDQIRAATFLISKAMPDPPQSSNLNVSGNLSVAWPLSKTKLDQ